MIFLNCIETHRYHTKQWPRVRVNHCHAYGTLTIKNTKLAVQMEDSKSCTCLFFAKEIGKPFTNNSF